MRWDFRYCVVNFKTVVVCVVFATLRVHELLEQDDTITFWVIRKSEYARAPINRNDRFARRIDSAFRIAHGEGPMI